MNLSRHIPCASWPQIPRVPKTLRPAFRKIGRSFNAGRELDGRDNCVGNASNRLAWSTGCGTILCAPATSPPTYLSHTLPSHSLRFRNAKFSDKKDRKNQCGEELEGGTCWYILPRGRFLGSGWAPTAPFLTHSNILLGLSMTNIGRSVKHCDKTALLVLTPQNSSCSESVRSSDKKYRKEFKSMRRRCGSWDTLVKMTLNWWFLVDDLQWMILGKVTLVTIPNAATLINVPG